MKRILIVDDDVGSRESLRLTFSRQYQTVLAENAANALRILAQQRMDIVLLDVMMPEKDGVALLKDIHELYPDMPCVMVSASVNVRPVVEAMKAGAYDFVVKPFDVEEIRRIVARAIENSALRRKVEILQSEVSREYPVNDLVGESASFKAALESVRRAADSDATVLIHGESGTGKELIARRLHTLSARHDEPFVPVHCAALPEALLESELFGHEKGAFTGAESRKLGRFDLAGAGTLFFDEIGEMSLSTQVKLLRVLQEREYMRLGGTQVVRTSARIVAATARDLADEVRKHTFRDDLFYRLNVIQIMLPPLRERPEDVPLLARYFLDLLRRNMNLPAREFDPAALQIMREYAWPGNARELRNTIERVLVLHGHADRVSPDHLPDAMRSAPSLPTPARKPGHTQLAEAVAAFERELVVDALRQTKGIQTRAAKLLGTTRRILNYRMRKLDIRASGNL
jgi:DNA-binding NtrC family response regulator